MEVVCNYCGCGNIHVIGSYKHNWSVCDNCHNVWRALKDKLPLDSLKLLKPLVPKVISKMLWHDTVCQTNNKCFYDYYQDEVTKNSSESKWQNEFAEMEKQLRQWNISIQGPVLDISGGPGFFASELEARGINTILTEFSPEACKKMQNVLGVNCKPFDYNRDSLREVFDSNKFQWVFIRGSINFCSDLQTFCNELADITKKDGYVYVDFILPTLGVCLRWQHDEYTYETLIHPHTFLRCFESAGFKAIHNFYHAPYHAFHGKVLGYSCTGSFLRALPKSIFTLIFSAFYYMKGKSASALNTSMQQKGVGYIFQKI